MTLACGDADIPKDESNRPLMLDAGYIVPPEQIKAPIKTLLKKPRISKLPEPIIHREKEWNKTVQADRSFELIKKGKIKLNPNKPNYPKAYPIKSKPFRAEQPIVLPAKNIYTKNEDILSFKLENTGGANALYQDHEGALWGCGRYGGMWKYDGQNFSYYSLAQGLIDESVLDMVFDRFGNHWIGTSTGLVKFDGQTFTNYTGENEVSPNKPTKLVEDTNGNIWVGSKDGLYFIDQANQTITHFTQENGLLQNEINAMVLGQSGELWLAYNHVGISRLSIQSDPEHPSFIIENYVDQNAQNISLIQSLFVDEDGNLYAGSFRELLLMQTNNVSDESNLSGHYFSIDKLGTNWIYDITQDQYGRIWLAGRNDIVILNQPGPHPKDFLEINVDSEQFTGYAFAILNDRADNVWILAGEARVDKIKINKKLNSLQKRFGLVVNAMHVEEDDDNNIWFVSAKRGIFCLKRDKPNQAEILLEYPLRAEFNAHSSLTIDSKRNIWVSETGGLMKIILDQSTDSGLIHQYGKEEGLKMSTAFDIQEDREGSIWLAENTLSLYDKSNVSEGGGVFQLKGDTLYQYGREQGLLAPNTYRMAYDKQGIFWFNSLYHGITKYAPKTKEREAIWTHYPGGRIFPKSTFFISVHPDNGVFVHNLDGMLHLFSENNGRHNSVNFYHGDIRQNDQAYAFSFEDSKGFRWLANGNELTRLQSNSEGSVLEGFNFADDTISVSVPAPWSRKIFESFDGRIWMLTAFDLISFHPDEVKVSLEAKETYFRNVKVAGQDINWKNRSKLKVEYDKNEVEFEYYTIEIDQPEKVEHRYFLKGNQNTWREPTRGTSISYPNLGPGKYVLNVSSRIKPGPWGPAAKYPFTILPPWWRTWYAYAFYALFSFALLASAWKWQVKRLKEKSIIEKRILEAEKIRELDEAKTHFFSNLSHEFRTPLTVILGMSEEIEKPMRARKLIRQSGQNLMRLVNQMLDFSKMEAGKLKLNVKPGEFISFMRYLFESFESLAEYKQISLTLNTSIDSLMMEYDEDKMQHIVSNLMSNAIKFTPIGGAVRLDISSENNKLKLTVSDTGVGISEKMKPFVFDRYFQGREAISKGAPGTGIGLSFAKELVELMNGSIRVESELGKGSQFELMLPIHTSDIVEPPKKNIEPKADRGSTNGQIINNEANIELPVLLLIEDNAEVVSYVRHVLESSYDIRVAEDGEVGLKKAFVLIPDIIISDVMMPFKDGFEVTDTLKNDERTSHIPIILLTAKADMDSRLEGLKRGADAYLAKPFDKNELMIRLQNMIELRDKVRNNYTRSQFAEKPTIQVKKIDPAIEEMLVIEDAFIKKVNDLIDLHMGEENFNVDELSKAVGMDRSQLYRKLKALTNYSTVAYLRGRRLQKAKEILSEQNLNISEVAYKVGFADPSYFSKAFSKEFGLSPKAFVKRK